MRTEIGKYNNIVSKRDYTACLSGTQVVCEPIADLQEELLDRELLTRKQIDDLRQSADRVTRTCPAFQLHVTNRERTAFAEQLPCQIFRRVISVDMLGGTWKDRSTIYERSLV